MAFRSSVAWEAFPGFQRFAKIGAAIALIAGLAACVSPNREPQPVDEPDLTFDTGRTLNVAATNIVLVEDYHPPLRRPNIEHEFKVLPADVLRHWANERLHAAGADGLFTVTVKEASVVENELKKTQGFQGRFKIEEDRELLARLVVGVTYQGPTGAKSSDFEVTARKTLLESASLHDRERAYYWLIERLKAQTEAVLEREVASAFAEIID